MSDTKKLLGNPLEHLIKAAQLHGQDSEPDHEVGDLQDLLRAMWALLPPDKRQEFLDGSEVQQVLECAHLLEDLPIIHGYWMHMFGVGKKEDQVRFAFDTREKRIVAMQIHDGPLQDDYVQASAAHIDDVLDSLQNANPEALENPEDFGLSRGYVLPAWAVDLSEPVARERSDAPRG